VVKYEELIVKMLTELNNEVREIKEQTTRIELHLENVTDKIL
jgi:hypothetical protein